MNDSERLDFTLEQVAQRVGDPAPLVFERLYAEAPELQALFCNDASGAVRAEMFLRALECLQDAAGARLYGSATPPTRVMACPQRCSSAFLSSWSLCSATPWGLTGHPRSTRPGRKRCRPWAAPRPDAHTGHLRRPSRRRSAQSAPSACRQSAAAAFAPAGGGRWGWY